jgi:hypothetical protein
MRGSGYCIPFFSCGLGVGRGRRGNEAKVKTERVGVGWVRTVGNYKINY